MIITPINIPPPQAAYLDPNAGRNNAVARAARTINAVQLAGPGRELSFAIDPKTRLAVVQVVDTTTREVVDQLPNAYVLQVARQIEELLSTNSASVR